ncbi:MAG TPA: hypothetical protein VF335_02230 [Chitinivibrionales bacterium]
MAVIFHVLKEEFERLKETENGYSKAIANMPRGTPRMQQRRSKKYLYLEYRDGGKIIHKYIGPQDSDQSKKVLDTIAQRRRYEKLLNETKSALKDVRKVLRGKI